MDQKITDIIERLEKSPIHAMSLGNHELFHSNFWAWLFTNTSQKNEYAKVFFDTIDSNCEFTVEREQGNRDITIWQKDFAYVIENKLKSIPTVKQLQGYSSELGDRCSEAVFTGMINPYIEESSEPCFSEKNKEKKWVFKSYRHIGDKIKEIAQKETSDKYRQLISDYAQMICDANDLLDEIIASIGKDNLIIRPVTKKGEKSLLERIRLQDIVLKMNASLLLRQDIQIDGLTREFSFNNKKATLSFKLKNKETGNIAGIQIEGNQYRRFLESETPYICDTIFKKAESVQWFDKGFDRNIKPKTVFEKRTSMSPKNGNQYDVYEKPHSFVYQYWDLDKAYKPNKGELFTTVSFSEILKQLQEDLRLAKQLDWLK